MYVQDLDSNVFALDEKTGRLVWRTRVRQVSGGPNGLAAGDGRIYGNSSRAAFALDEATGKVLWRRRLVRTTNETVDIAPLVADGLVFTSTVGFAPGGRGALYALNARTGQIRWRFETIRDPWPYPSAGGGGAWYTPSLGAGGVLYVGISNPDPWGGTRLRPNGGAFPGPLPTPMRSSRSAPAPGSSSGTTRCAARRARLRLRGFADRRRRHRVRRGQGEASGRVEPADGPATVVAGGRPASARPRPTAEAADPRLPGPLGRSPDADVVRARPALRPGGRALHARERRDDAAPADLRPGNGVVTALAAASGTKLWTRRLGSPATGCTTVANDVVFAPTLDGRLYGLAASSGHVLWETRMPAGINSCPAVSGDLLLVGAGVPRPGGDVREVVAYGVGEGRP